MEKQSENETKSTIESAGMADEALSEKELDEVSGGDEAPKESVTFQYGGVAIRYGHQ